MASKVDYETRPFSEEIWGQMKELRRERFWNTWTAQAEGGLCVTGFAWNFASLLAGFGKLGNPSMGTGFTRIAREGTSDEGLRQYTDLSTAKGLTPVCGAIGAHLGQVFAGISTVSPSGEKITPDFIFQPTGCHAIRKGAQICADILGVPMLVIDYPHEGTPDTQQYLFDQLSDAIEWIENRTKKKFDDEKFIAAVHCDIDSRVYWAKICELMKTIPTPITYRQAMTVRLPIVAYAYTQKTVDYMKVLYAEVQERVREGVAGAPFEKKRLNHEGIHPLYRPDVLRWPEEYGAVFVQGNLGQSFGYWTHTEDGHSIPGKTVEESGIELRSREDALHALVDLFKPLGSDTQTSVHSLYTLRRAQDYHADGVMLHLARRCPALTAGMFAEKADLLKAGIAVGTYEASEADPNEFDEVRVRSEFALFLESLGLTRITG